MQEKVELILDLARVVFAGFSADALRDRINNAKAKVLLTANEGMRGGRAILLKRTADEAVAFCPSIEVSTCT